MLNYSLFDAYTDKRCAQIPQCRGVHYLLPKYSANAVHNCYNIPSIDLGLTQRSGCTHNLHDPQLNISFYSWSGKYFMHRAGVLRAKQQRCVLLDYQTWLPKISDSYLQPADLCKSCHASSHLPAPPTSAAPIPPPLDLMSPQGEDKEQTVLYDSPLTATSLLSKSSLEDYRAGYILTLDSVPERKVSGQNSHPYHCKSSISSSSPPPSPRSPKCRGKQIEVLYFLEY